MKRAIIGASVALAIGLSGCNSNGTLSPTAQNIIQIAYTAVCTNEAAITAAAASSSSQGVQAALVSMQTLCASPAPTTVTAAGLDIVQVFVALLPYMQKIGVKAQAVAEVREYIRQNHVRISPEALRGLDGLSR